VAERSIQRDIQLRFGALPWLRLWRMNVGMGKTLGGQMVRFGIPGMADLTGLVACGRRLEVEVKGPDGRQSADQRTWERVVTGLGGLYCLARSTDDLQAFLDAHLAGCASCRAAAGRTS
jgi:hypothetical protein